MLTPSPRPESDVEFPKLPRRSVLLGLGVALLSATTDSALGTEPAHTHTVDELLSNLQKLVGQKVEVRGHLTFCGSPTYYYTDYTVSENGAERSFPAERDIDTYRLHLRASLDSPFIEIVPSAVDSIPKHFQGRDGDFARYPVQVTGNVFKYRDRLMLEVADLKRAK